MTNKFESKCLQKFYVSSKHEKECYMKTTSYLEEPNRQFCQHFMRRTTQQTFSAVNLVSQKKTTKLFFSSQVRKQFKLLAVLLKSLRCCLQSDKLMNCQVWKFYKDLFLNCRVYIYIYIYIYIFYLGLFQDWESIFFTGWVPGPTITICNHWTTITEISLPEIVDISRPWLIASGISFPKWRTKTIVVRESVSPAIF